MKGSNSLQTQRFIAQYGKSAWHPVCQAWLVLRGLDAKLEEVTKETAQIEKIINSAKQQKEQARGLYEQFYKEGKQKEAIEAAELLRKIGEHLPKVQTHYEEGVKLRSVLRESRPVLVAPFKREYDAAIRTGNVQARALRRVQKRWNDKKVCLGNSDRRTLEILKMIHDKVIKATWATKDGAGVGYLEAVRGGDRPLSDEVWQGRFTIKEIYSHLLATYGPRVAGDKDGKEIRRTMRGLGIRPAADQRGRRWKPPCPVKQEPRRPRGRPHANLDDVHRASLDHRVNTTGHVLKKEYGKLNAGNTSYGGLTSWVKSARKENAAIDREITKLQLLRGGRKGKYVY